MTSSRHFLSQTTHYAARLKSLVEQGKAPVIVYLNGPLGAGKTTFVKELLAELGFAENEVQSPTFLKLLEYRNPDGWLALHIDTYRMDKPADLEALTLEGYPDFQFCFVEWPELFKGFLAENPGIKMVWGTPFEIELKIDSSHQLSE